MEHNRLKLYNLGKGQCESYVHYYKKCNKKNWIWHFISLVWECETNLLNAWISPLRSFKILIVPFDLHAFSFLLLLKPDGIYIIGIMSVDWEKQHLRWNMREMSNENSLIFNETRSRDKKWEKAAVERWSSFWFKPIKESYRTPWELLRMVPATTL